MVCPPGRSLNATCRWWKALLVFSAVTVLVAAFTLSARAAAPAASVQSKAARPDRPLIFVVHGRPALFEEYRKLLDEYEKETGIGVDMITVDSSAAKWQKILPMVAGGTAPDVVAGVSVEFPQYAQSGLLLPLNDLIAATKTDLSQLIPVLVKELSWKGEQFIIPYGVSELTMYYNVDMYEEAGLKPPPRHWGDPAWDWERFLADALKLTRRQGETVKQWGIVGPYWDSWLTLPIQWGSDWVTSDLTRFIGNEPGPVAALQALQDLAWRHRVMPADAANMPTEFAGGQAALYGDGTWRIQILLESKVNWDFAPFFQVNGFKAAGAINPVGMGVIKGSRYPQAAFDLIRWLTLEQSPSLRYAAAAGAIPALKTNLGPWVEFMRSAAGNRNLNFGLLLEEVQNHGWVLQVRKSPAWEDIDRKMRPAVMDVLLNKTSARQAMDQIAPEINKLLAGGLAKAARGAGGAGGAAA